MADKQFEKIAADQVHQSLSSVNVSASEYQSYHADAGSNYAHASAQLVHEGALPSLSLRSISDTVGSAIDSAAAKVGNALSSGWEEAKDLGSRTIDFACEHPGYAAATVVGAVLGGEVLAPAVGIGMVAGAVIGAAGLDAAVYGATKGAESILE